MHGRCHAYVDSKAIAPADLIAILTEHDMLDKAVVYGGRDFLRALKKLNPSVRLLPAFRDPARLDELIEDLRPYGVDTAWEILSPELIARCHERGIRVFSDAMGNHETLEDYQKAIRWGIDVIQTDHPARVSRAIELMEAK
jgi:glycerophosphoryl diester phosphodiesterase